MIGFAQVLNRFRALCPLRVGWLPLTRCTSRRRVSAQLEQVCKGCKCLVFRHVASSSINTCGCWVNRTSIKKACLAGHLRQLARLNRALFGSLIGFGRHQKRRIGPFFGLPVTRETPRLGKRTKTDLERSNGFALVWNRFRASLSAPRGVASGDRMHVPKEAGSPT